MRIHVGFTGTHYGMREIQKQKFYKLIKEFEVGFHFHHGDCIGSDEQAHDFVNLYTKSSIIIHPPKNPKKRAFCKDYFELREEDDYIKRNHKMIDECSVLIATPAQNEEILRSGTWSTIRYARKKKIDIYIIFPNGSLKTEKPNKITLDFSEKE